MDAQLSYIFHDFFIHELKASPQYEPDGQDV